MIWVYALNLISRWILFGVAAYKTYKERSKGWMFLMVAFLLSAITPEQLLLEPLGLKLVPEVAFVLGMVNTALQGLFLLLAARYLETPNPTMRDSIVILGFGIFSYLWLVVTNTTHFYPDLTIRALGPFLVYALGYVYAGIVFYRYIIVKKFEQLLFPVGMMLLGLLNATYPVTATWKWFVPYGFFLGTMFRIMMASGALSFMFYLFFHIEPEVERDIPPGAFLYPTRESVTREFGDWELEPGLLMITRKDVNKLKQQINPEAIVFWITRTKEGKLHDSPTIYAISPTKIDILIDLIARAVERGYRVVYIDAFEYLILENGFDNAIKFLLNVKDRVLANKGTLILVVNSSALDTFQKKILEREFSRG
ncbi:hypothetical protein A7C91_07815 [Thermococcus piezophilus]|uniref:DUF835 domain-containing protein n=2 Tax=Thermococcus piezophilus TaxID=1712654 RepID=A0A172WI09_9EURY|nr:hypothetical protein A7C91_07815 [Thermococcus piezophilus]